MSDNNILKVQKRDGRLVKFNKNNIIRVMEDAYKETKKSSSDENNTIQIPEDFISLANKTADRIENSIKTSISVEQVQDKIEKALMASGYKDVAKEYILYRNKRTTVRELNSKLIRNIISRNNASNVVNSNANVDERSFSGREKEASSDVQKYIAFELAGVSDDMANAHKNMLIYQHDAEKSLLGIHNCAFLDFKHIFDNGFILRNGSVRPPKSFNTACQLVAVAFQCQSQVQFGGVGSCHIDTDLAPFIKMSFFKHFKDGLKFIEENDDKDSKNN